MNYIQIVLSNKKVKSIQKNISIAGISFNPLIFLQIYNCGLDCFGNCRNMTIPEEESENL